VVIWVYSQFRTTIFSSVVYNSYRVLLRGAFYKLYAIVCLSVWLCLCIMIWFVYILDKKAFRSIYGLYRWLAVADGAEVARE